MSRILILALLIATTPLSAQTDPAAVAPAPSASTAIDVALTKLAEEAVAAMQSRKLISTTPDFAQRSGVKVPPEAVTASLRRRLHTNDFIDAYARWQLLSYEPTLGPFDHASFDNFLRQAPRPLNNPWGRFRLVRLLRGLHDQGIQVDEEYRQMIENDLAEARSDAKDTDSLSLAGTAFMDWVDAQLGDDDVHRARWRIYRCSAVINAAWAADAEKTAVCEGLEALRTDANVTDEQRREIIQKAQRLVGSKKEYIVSVTFSDGGLANVEFKTVGITQKDANRWLECMTGTKAESR